MKKILSWLQSIKSHLWILLFMIIGGLLAYPFYISFSKMIIEVNTKEIVLRDWLTVGATIVGLVFVAIITRKQTDRQIRAQADNTREQIENQNKQMHRPFLSFDFKSIKSDDIGVQKNQSMSYLCFSKHYNKIANLMDSKIITTNQMFHYELKLTNLGKGPAQNICFYDCRSRSIMARAAQKTYGNEKDSITAEPDLLAPITIFKNKKHTFNIDIIYRQPPIDEEYDSATILVLFSDINGNIYKSLIAFSLEFDEENGENMLTDAVYSEFYEENHQYKKWMKYLDLNEREIIKKYNKRRNTDSYKS